MAKTPYAPKLDTLNDLHSAIEALWGDLMEARHALHFLVSEVEEDWNRSVNPPPGHKKAENHIVDGLSARTWLASTAMISVDEATDRLTFLINEMPLDGEQAR